MSQSKSLTNISEETTGSVSISTPPLTSISTSIGIWTDVGEETQARTGTPGYLPVELLRTSVEAGPENDVFSFGVLMLEVLVLRELWENNMFAHSVSHVMFSQPQG